MATIGVDFDGVVHAYSKGWQNGSIYDEPLPGALDSLRSLMSTYSVFIHTARTDLESVAEWLQEQSGIPCVADPGCDHGFWTDQSKILVTSRKVAAIAYIDDRAIRFDSWAQALAELQVHEAAYHQGAGPALS